MRAQLNWQNSLSADALAATAGIGDVAVVERALATLGSRGLAGFDVTTGRYFHRELPFDLGQVETLQPRLKAARKLAGQAGAVRLVDRGDGRWEAEVTGTEVTHLVRLDEENGDKCTCPWFAKHRGQRGPCKHILAARLIRDGEGADGS